LKLSKEEKKKKEKKTKKTFFSLNCTRTMPQTVPAAKLGSRVN